MPLSENVARSLSHQAPKAGTDQVERIEKLRAAAKAYAEVVEECVGKPYASPSAGRQPSRERSLALTHLEDSLMWAVKGVVLE